MASLAYILMVASAFFQSSNAAEYESSTVGREFFFGVLPYASDCCKDSDHKIPLDITNVSPNDARVSVQIPYFKNDTYFDIPARTTKRINLRVDIQRDRTFVEARGIKVTSNYNVSVLVSNVYSGPNTIDTYNVLPVTVIGNDYIISSYGSRHGSGRGGMVSIAGVSNHTNVTIVNSTHLLRSEVINMFDIFQYLCDQCDLTGVRVISDKNVFVVAGSTYTDIPLSGSDGEYIASEMIPFSSLSQHYIVPPVLPKSAFMLRILSNSSFNIKVSNVTRSFTTIPSPSELYFGTEAVVLMATSPFSVSQYGVNYDYDNVNGAPFMVATPGVEQYISNYNFNVPNGYYGNMIHYVAVIIPKQQKDGLVLDGTSLRTYNTTKSIKSLRVPAPFDNYTIMTFSVSEGFHHFFHTNEVKFGLLVYGHGYSRPWALSYAFYAGYDLDRKHDKKMCYSCHDLYHVDLCDTVTQCGKQEVCYVERFMESGQKKYKTGCLQQWVCDSKQKQSSHTEELCFECCSGDYCNNKGCGENGIPARDSRGPICFDCEHVSSPEECKKVTPCDSNQECRIEEYKWFDHSHFKLGCGHGLVIRSNKGSEKLRHYAYAYTRNTTNSTIRQGQHQVYRSIHRLINYHSEISHTADQFEVAAMNVKADIKASVQSQHTIPSSVIAEKMLQCPVQCDPAKRMLAQDFKRATPVCRYCCSDDYCNRNCTTDPSGQSGSVIIG